ncbi:MAG: undecaprenyl-diphosphate phosphatase [Spirochaetia bacterium]
MTYIEALTLGIIQGVAEFLPISSSGHLYIAKYYFGIQEISSLFDVALHIATLGAVFFVFHQKIRLITAAGLRWVRKNNTPTDALLIGSFKIIILATCVTVVIGYFMSFIPTRITRVAMGLVYTSILLIATRILPVHKLWKWTVSAFIIGLFQAIAVLPGISRSGSTIFAGQLAGFSKEDATEFSFILSIPIIFAALIFSLKDLNTLSGQIPIGPFLLAILVAFLSGVFALKFLIHLISKAKLFAFAYYLIPLATFILLKH